MSINTNLKAARPLAMSEASRTAGSDTGSEVARGGWGWGMLSLQSLVLIVSGFARAERVV